MPPKDATTLHTGEEVPYSQVINVSKMFSDLINADLTGSLLGIDLALLAHETPPGGPARRAAVERHFPNGSWSSLVEYGLVETHVLEIHDLVLAVIRACASNAGPDGFDLTEPITGRVVHPYRM